MQPFFEYILKLSISLAMVYLFYIIALRRLTFYNCNRWYLLFYSLICFYIPFINLSAIFTGQLENSTVVQVIPVVTFSGAASIESNIQTGSSFPNPSTWIPALLFTGTCILLIRLLIQYFSFLQLKKQATLIHDNGVKIYQVEKNIIPFSMGNSIFLNTSMQNDEGLKEIIRHEFVHVKQKHSIDILFTEILCIINWYNPFAWMIRNAVRQNLEFIADNNVLQHGFDKKEYQYLLLKVIGVSQFSIAPKFNFSSLKKRIVMMNKLKSAKVHLFKFLFALPLLAVLLLAFRESYSSMKTPVKKGATVFNYNDTVPKGSAKTLYPDTLVWVELPKNVKKISVKDRTAIVVLKTGTIEKYNIDNEKEFTAYQKKYGKLPLPPNALSTEEQWKKASGQIAVTGNSPLYIVDGKETTDLKGLNSNDLERIDVLKETPAIAAYGEKGKNGVVLITTKVKPAMAVTGQVKEVAIVPSAKLAAVSKRLSEVVITDVTPAKAVTGVPINLAIKEAFAVKPDVVVTGKQIALAKVVPDNVVVEVKELTPAIALKPVEVVVEGKKLITAVKPVVGEVALKGMPVTTTVNSLQKVVLDGKVATDLLYILDGKEVTKAEINNMKAEMIGSIRILTGKDAEKEYGEKGKGGVIIITTKPPVA